MQSVAQSLGGEWDTNEVSPHSETIYCKWSGFDSALLTKSPLSVKRCCFA